jgi:hypothetical protein
MVDSLQNAQLPLRGVVLVGLCVAMGEFAADDIIYALQLRKFNNFLTFC